MPYLLRSVTATARGVYLRSWRYGSQTDKMVGEALARDYWSQEKWRTWQKQRLAVVLRHAAANVPYYRDQWRRRRLMGDHGPFESLENWPILEKEVVRENPMAFVADGCKTWKMFHEHTSGTTGKPLNLWWSRATVKTWYALSEARWRIWYGVSRHERWAILGGQLVARVTQTKPPFWVWNRGLNQLYMSAYHLSAEFIPHYLDALARYRIRYLLGYTSSLYSLAQEILRGQRTRIPMKVIITNAEPVFDYQRELIEQAFECPVRETYGMAEIVAAAGECEEGTLHLWPEAGYVEVLGSGGKPVPNGYTGDLVCTGLLNMDMPLIRYRTGDRGSLSQDDARCRCGRGLPVLKEVSGRSDEVIYTKDGRSVGRMDPVFKADLPIREAQIIQRALNNILVKVVPDQSFGKADGRDIIERIQQRVGKGVTVQIQMVDQIPRSSNGKFRSVVCKLPPEQLSDIQDRLQTSG